MQLESTRLQNAFVSEEFRTASQFINKNRISGVEALAFDVAVTRLCEVLGYNRQRTIEWIYLNINQL